MLNATINNKQVSEYFFINKIERESAPTFKNNKPNQKKIKLFLTAKNDTLIAVDYLNTILFNKPKLTIEFSDQPDRIYYVTVEAVSTVSNSSLHGSLSVDFSVTDGVSYSKLSKQSKQDNNMLIFNNLGNAIAYPTITFTAKSNLKLFGLSHPSGKFLQFGFENGEDIIKVGDVIKIDLTECMLSVNGYQNFFTSASDFFGIEPGRTKIGITVNTGAPIPNVTATFKERYL